MNIIIDSSILVSLFNDKDIHHTRATQIFSQIADGIHKGLISSISIPETCGVLSRTIGKERSQVIYGLLQDYINYNFLTVEQITPQRIEAATILAINSNIKGADAIISSLALEMKSSLATFDKELKEKLKAKIEIISN